MEIRVEGPPVRRKRPGRRAVGIGAFVALIVLSSVFPAFSESAAGPEPGPLWPLDLPTRNLTSNFMEHRPGRFHAGLDLKTRERGGFPVRAVADGWISRLKTSANGYGKALYLSTADGRTYVYAHLERFADRLRPLVAAARERDGGYAVDLSLPRDRLPVRRGAVLALSGETGTLGPHLHFEVRDGDRPLNPQRAGFTVGDVLPPRLRVLRVHPAAPESRIAGGRAARSLRGEPTLSGELPPLAVRGPVAFSAGLVDASDGKGHRLEPYLLSVRLDGDTVFVARNEGFRFAEARASRLEWLEQDRRRERWLMRRPGNRLPGRSGGGWSLDPALMTPGTHRLAIDVADAEGNAVAVAFDLVVAAPDAAVDTATAWLPDPAGVALPDGPDGTRRWLTPFLMVAVAGGDTIAQPAVGEGGAGAPVWVAARDELDAEEILALDQEQGLRPAGWNLRVLAADWNATGTVDVPLTGLAPDSLGAEVAVYRRHRNGSWRFVERPRTSHGRPHVTLDESGRYALLRDEAPPYLGPGPFEGAVGPGPAPRCSAVTPPRWEVVAIGMEDRGAGIDPETLRGTLDGRPWYPEPDLPRHRLLAALPDSLAPGPHRLEIEVRDRAGRLSRRGYDLVLAP